MNATLISIINVFRNRGLRTLDHEGAESSVDLSTMLQWTVITIGLICGWEMPLGHDLILLTQMHGNAPVGVGLNFGGGGGGVIPLTGLPQNVVHIFGQKFFFAPENAHTTELT